MILAAVPAGSSRSAAWPAPISPTTGRCTGASAVAVTVSACRTAYPSIAELSNDGRLTCATTSSATTRPSASIRGWWYAASGSVLARIRARCSSTEMASAIAEDGVGGDPLRGAGRQLHVADHLDAVPERPVALDRERLGLPHRRRPVGEAPVEVSDQLV